MKSTIKNTDAPTRKLRWVACRKPIRITGSSAVFETIRADRERVSDLICRRPICITKVQLHRNEPELNKNRLKPQSAQQGTARADFRPGQRQVKGVRAKICRCRPGIEAKTVAPPNRQRAGQSGGISGKHWHGGLALVVHIGFYCPFMRRCPGRVHRRNEQNPIKSSNCRTLAQYSVM